jgi:hypothetical protein
MWIDPIVEEIHQTRNRIAAQFDFDVFKLGAHYMELQKEHADRLVSFPPRRPDGWVVDATAVQNGAQLNPKP